MKKTIFIILAVFAILLVILIAVPFIFKDKILERVDKEIAGAVDANVFYEYDKSGNQILYGIDTGFYISKKEHFYNEENKIYRTDDYRNDELINRTEYHWEENTRYGEVYDGKEQLIAKNIYIFGVYFFAS